MIRVITAEEMEVLKKSGRFQPYELKALQTGELLTLGLYIKARAALGEAPHSILENELQELMTKVFLMFTVLERKGLISMDELLEMNKTLEAEGAKNAERAKEAGTSPSP